MRKPLPLFLNQFSTFVIPAKAGIYFDFKSMPPIKSWAHKWIPACAGMTA